MRDGEGELDKRACLSEEDERIDAGERCLSELGDRGLLPIARFDLGAQTRHFVFAVACAAGQNRKRPGFRHRLRRTSRSLRVRDAQQYRKIVCRSFALYALTFEPVRTSTMYGDG